MRTVRDLLARGRVLPEFIWRFTNAFKYTINDGFFWDQYVRRHERLADGDRGRLLGSEWENEGAFIELLRRYSAPGLDALEIGCGGGRITSVAVNLFRHVYATDVSKEMLRRCRQDVPAGNLSLHQTDGFTLVEFGDGTADVVFSHDVFVHFSSLQVYSYLTEIRRVVKRGGVALLSFYDFSGSFHVFKELSLDLSRRRRFPPHMRTYFVTEEMVRTMASDLALEVAEVDRSAFLVIALRKPG